MCIIICVECDYIITSRHSIFNYDTLLLSCIEQQVPRNIYDILKGTSLKWRKSLQTYWHSKNLYESLCVPTYAEMC